MDWLTGFIANTLGLRARQGWVFLLVGLLMMASIRYGILTDIEAGSNWWAFFVLLTVTGFVILIVSAGSEMYAKACSIKAINRASKQAESERRHKEREAVITAEVLEGSEALRLLQLLRRDNPRFTGPAENYTLLRKGIIKSNLGAYDVVDAVWEDRVRLMPILEGRVANTRFRR